jgi:hypothetical protein
MLIFTGKRLARLRINVDPELIGIITERAERHKRPVSMEVDHLLEVGLCNDPEEDVHSQFRLYAAMMAPPRPVKATRKERIA